VSNPILNDKKLEEARSGWAAPTAPSAGGELWGPPGSTGTGLSDGPVTPWKSGVMTVKGSITATAVLFTLLLVSATAGWMATESVPVGPNGEEQFSFPGIAMLGVIIGFACVIALYFKPKYAKILGPIYAVAQGFFVGAISAAYQNMYDGIVVQAAGATLAVVAVMLVLYRTNIIKVTERFRRIIIGATLGVMVLYGVSLLIHLFGGQGVSFINQPSAFGIGFSIFVCVLAAMNLALDFDFIEKGSKMGLSKDYEWVAAVGLLVTIVWLYLEILRLLAKLRQN
jgi:uncharacterized YccA/Bax inhibitor family protein